MAEGTLGRQIMDGQKTVFIHKLPVEVNAKIVQMSGLSGHADYFELLHWLEPWKSMPKRVFVTHGEPAMSQAMALHFKEERGWDSLLPVLDQTVEL
jgi:metallo-beta-lactamase family protein